MSICRFANELPVRHWVGVVERAGPYRPSPLEFRMRPAYRLRPTRWLLP